jgi:hypothetical protein
MTDEKDFRSIKAGGDPDNGSEIRLKIRRDTASFPTDPYPPRAIFTAAPETMQRSPNAWLAMSQRFVISDENVVNSDEPIATTTDLFPRPIRLSAIAGTS